MSDHIPLELQIEIIRRLPVKSLIRFSCVSKQWKDLIHSSNFVNDYSLHTHHQIQQPLLFVAERDGREPYRLFVDDDTFPQNKCILFVPESVNQLSYSKVVGSSHGLFCLVGDSMKNIEGMVAVIWNPMIRKSIYIVLPDVVSGTYPRGHMCIIRFGVCPNTCDPKIVKINEDMKEVLEDNNCTNWQVEVYSLSSGVWRSPLGNLLDKWLKCALRNEQVVIDGFIYWIARESVFSKSGLSTLISFDLTSEEFKQVYLPDGTFCAHIFKFKESLAILEWNNFPQVNIWIRDDQDASNSFTKLFTFDGNGIDSYISTQPVFRRNGQLIMLKEKKGLVVYEPCSNHFNDLGVHVDLYSICRDRDSLYVSSYAESLLLLDQSHTSSVRTRRRKKTYDVRNVCSYGSDKPKCAATKVSRKIEDASDEEVQRRRSTIRRRR